MKKLDLTQKIWQSLQYLLITVDLPSRVLKLTPAFHRKSCYKTVKALKYYLFWTVYWHILYPTDSVTVSAQLRAWRRKSRKGVLASAGEKVFSVLAVKSDHGWLVKCCHKSALNLDLVVNPNCDSNCDKSSNFFCSEVKIFLVIKDEFQKMSCSLYYLSVFPVVIL